MKQRNLKHYIVIFYGRLELAKKNGGHMRKTGKKLALILTMAITLTLFTSCGGK